MLTYDLCSGRSILQNGLPSIGCTLLYVVHSIAGCDSTNVPIVELELSVQEIEDSGLCRSHNERYCMHLGGNRADSISTYSDIIAKRV